MSSASGQSQRRKRKAEKEALRRRRHNELDTALRNWFTTLGVEPLWDHMTASARQMLLRSRWPKPTIEFEGAPPPYWPSLRQSLLSLWDAHESDLGSLERAMPTSEFITLLYPMAFALNRCGTRHPSADVQASFTILKQLAVACFGRACNALADFVADGLRMFSRLDSALFQVQLQFRECGADKKQVAFVVSSQPPQSRRFCLGGGFRRGFRLGKEVSHDRSPWISLPAIAAVTAAPLPVYVQEHALSRLEQRAIPDKHLSNPHELAICKALARHHLAESLLKPTIIRRNGQHLLIEYRWGECRFGYLPCQIMDDALLIRSFLFLTMETMPEARKLYKELRLSRSDIEWMRLDSLNTFVYSDIHRDPTLAELFRRCGCGSLLEIAGHVNEELVEKGVADALHKFMRPRQEAEAACPSLVG